MTRTTLIMSIWIALHVAGVFLIPHAVAGDSPVEFLARNWGFHFLAYYPAPAAVIAYTLAIATLLPPVHNRLLSGLSRLVHHTQQYSIRAVFGVASFVTLPVFWQFRQKYAILGDGYVRARELERGHVHHPGGPFNWVLVQVCSASPLDGVETYQVASALLGIPFVLLSLLVAREIGRNAVSRALCGLAILTSGLVQFYFGYMETYSAVPVLILLFVWLVLKSDTARWAVVPSALALVLALIIHPLTGVLIPAGLYLVWYHLVRGRSRVHAAVLLGIVGLGLWAATIAGLVNQSIRGLLPIFPTEDQTYALLTLTNAWERLNGLILAAPLVIPVVATAILLSARVTSLRPSTVVILVSAGTGALGCLGGNFILGSQDWDLMAVASFPVHLAVALYVTRLLESVGSVALSPVFAAGLIHTAPWILLNHSDLSISRMEGTLRDEPATYFETHDPVVRAAMFIGEQGGKERRRNPDAGRGSGRVPWQLRHLLQPRRLLL